MRRFVCLAGVPVLIFVLIQTAQAQMRSPYIYRQPPVLTKRDKELTAIDAADKAKFAGFLEDEQAGFVRLHDAANCNFKSAVVNASEPCPWNIPGKATSYSFRKEKYRSAFFSDLALFESNLYVVGVNLIGYLVDLGDVALDKVSLRDAGIKEMSNFAVSDNIREIEKQFAAARKGFRNNGFLYRSALPLKENTTYALRSVAYQGKIHRKVNGFKINVLEGDKRIDLTLVFRVIRKHEDGSVSLLWKELGRKDSPKLVFDKSDKK